MVGREVLEIEYGTGNLKFEKIRKGVLQNKEVLGSFGYKCIWNGDLNLEGIMDEDDLMARKYLPCNDHILTSFGKDGLVFTVVAFTRSKRAKIIGSKRIYLSERDNLREDFDHFEEITGVHLNMKTIDSYIEN